MEMLQLVLMEVLAGILIDMLVCLQSGWEQAGEIERNAVEYCATEVFQQDWKGIRSAVWSRNLSYNEDTRKMDWGDQDENLRWLFGVTRKDKIRNEHIRGTTRVANESGECFQKDDREKIELVRRGDGESVEGGYTRGKEVSTIENKMERSMPMRL